MLMWNLFSFLHCVLLVLTFAHATQHLPNNFKIEVALSKRDLFFDTRVVAAYLDHCMDEALNHHTFECTHGGILFRPDILEHVVHMVTRVEE